MISSGCIPWEVQRLKKDPWFLLDTSNHELLYFWKYMVIESWRHVWRFNWYKEISVWRFRGDGFYLYYKLDFYHTTKVVLNKCFALFIPISCLEKLFF